MFNRILSFHAFFRPIINTVSEYTYKLDHIVEPVRRPKRELTDHSLRKRPSRVAKPAENEPDRSVGHRERSEGILGGSPEGSIRPEHILLFPVQMNQEKP
jgi:hypothetical protein